MPDTAGSTLLCFYPCLRRLCLHFFNNMLLITVLRGQASPCRHGVGRVFPEEGHGSLGATVLHVQFRAQL